MKMKCPICGKIYWNSSATKQCPLRNYPKCGSTKLVNACDMSDKSVDFLLQFGLMAVLFGIVLILRGFWGLTREQASFPIPLYWGLFIGGIIIACGRLFSLITPFYFLICESCGESLPLAKRIFL